MPCMTVERMGRDGRRTWPRWRTAASHERAGLGSRAISRTMYLIRIRGREYFGLRFTDQRPFRFGGNPARRVRLPPTVAHRSGNAREVPYTPRFQIRRRPPPE